MPPYFRTLPMRTIFSFLLIFVGCVVGFMAVLSGDFGALIMAKVLIGIAIYLLVFKGKRSR